MATCLGVVLKTTPLRESDLLVQLYTDEHGRVSAVARGARKSQRRFAGTLSLLVLARYDLGRRPRGDLWGLDSAEVVREWTDLSRDVVGVAHASYVAELVGALLPPEAPDPEALSLILQLWDSLADAGPSPGALRAIELALLDLAGHRPALEACAACSATDVETNAVFDPTRGGLVCRRCAASSRGPSVRPIDSGTLGYLRAVAIAAAQREVSASTWAALAGEDLESRDHPVGARIDDLPVGARAGGLAAARALDSDPRFSPADRASGREAFVGMVSGLVGRPLRSLEYIAKLGAASRRDGS